MDSENETRKKFMSELQEIDVYIGPDGKVRIEVRGVKGEKCLDITRDMEQLLGGTILERDHTDEFEYLEEAETDWVHAKS